MFASLGCGAIDRFRPLCRCLFCLVLALAHRFWRFVYVRLQTTARMLDCRPLPQQVTCVADAAEVGGKEDSVDASSCCSGAFKGSEIVRVGGRE